jgi:hypothetical protein
MIPLLAMEEEIVSVLDSVPAGRGLTVLFVRSKCPQMENCAAKNGQKLTVLYIHRLVKWPIIVQLVGRLFSSGV